MSGLRSSDTRPIVEISRNLLDHQLNSHVFFDPALLRFMKESLPFAEIAIVIYNEDLDYLSVVQDDKIQFADSAYYYFWRRDFCGRYISKNFHDIKTEDEPLLVRSTDLIPSSEYDGSTYVQFLNQHYQLHYSTSLPFGSNGRFRIVFYKTKEEDDFTDTELDVLSDIYTLVSGAFSAYERIRRNQAISSLKDDALDESSVGIMLLDSAFSILEYNSCAVDFLCTITGKADIHSACFDMLSGMFFGEPQVKTAYTKQVNGFKVIVTPKVITDELGVVSKYYALKLKPDAAGVSAKRPKAATSSLDCLTAREMELVSKLVEDMTYQEIADSLCISVSTVRKHLQNIFRKLNINNQRNLISMYIQAQMEGATL